MSIEFKNPEGVAPPVASYRHVAIVSGASRLLVLAGQVGQAVDGSFPVTVEQQFEQALDNVLAIVTSEGGSAASVARLSCFLTEPPKNFAEIASSMQRLFPDGPPAMSWIYVAGLFAPNVKVEIEAIAGL